MHVYGIHSLLPVHILIGIFLYAYGQTPGSSWPWLPSASSPSQSALPPLVFCLDGCHLPLLPLNLPFLLWSFALKILPCRFPFQMCTSFATHKAKLGSKIPLPNPVSIPQVLCFLGSLNPNDGAVQKTDRCITKKNLRPKMSEHHFVFTPSSSSHYAGPQW